MVWGGDLILSFAEWPPICPRSSNLEVHLCSSALRLSPRSALGLVTYLFSASRSHQIPASRRGEVMPTHPAVLLVRQVGREAAPAQGVFWSQVPRPQRGQPWRQALPRLRAAPLMLSDAIYCNTGFFVSVWAPATSIWPSVPTCGPTAPSPSTTEGCQRSSTSPSSTAWVSQEES